MKKALIIGNGESRSWFRPMCSEHPRGNKTILDDEVVTWGCNAIYRDGPHCVHNLVAMDYAMQQEIYASGWCDENPEHNNIHNVYFANWNVVPAEIADGMLMGFDIPESFIHRNRIKTNQCVIGGKDPAKLSEKIEETLKQFPNLDAKDVKLKMEKDVGIWITYVNEFRDEVSSIEGHEGWATGNTALSLACQSDAEEIYILGFDLSSYDKLLNNMYKGTTNYLPKEAKGFNPVNWINQIKEIFDNYPDKTFYWTDCNDIVKSSVDGMSRWGSNINTIIKEELCEKLQIV